MFCKILARIVQWRRRFSHLHPQRRIQSNSVELFLAEEQWNLREERVAGDLKMFKTLLLDLYHLTKLI